MAHAKIYLRNTANLCIGFGLCAMFFATSLSHVLWLGMVLWATQASFWDRMKHLIAHPFAQCCLVWFVWLYVMAVTHPSAYADSLGFASKHAQRMLIPLCLMCIPFQSNERDYILIAMLSGLVIFCVYISFAQVFGWHQSNIVQLSVLTAMFIGLIVSRFVSTRRDKAIVVVGLFLLVFLFFINKERSGVAVFLALVGGLGCYVGQQFLTFKRLFVAMTAVLSLVVFLLWLSPVMSGRIVKAYHEIWMFSDGDILTAVGARLALYGAVFDILKVHPLMGLGLGGFEAYFPTTALGKMFSGAEILASNPHQNFLSILADQGVIGLCVFTGIMMRLYFTPSRNRMAWLTVWIAFYVGGIFNSFWVDRQVIIICFVLFALLSHPIANSARNESRFI